MTSNARRATEKAQRQELIAAAKTVGCVKNVYVDQAGARLALEALREAKPELPAMRVYPCDICPAWHLTSKHVGRKVFPWDKDPEWTRPPKQ